MAIQTKIRSRDRARTFWAAALPLVTALQFALAPASAAAATASGPAVGSPGTPTGADQPQALQQTGSGVGGPPNVLEALANVGKALQAQLAAAQAQVATGSGVESAAAKKVNDLRQSSLASKLLGSRPQTISGLTTGQSQYPVGQESRGQQPGVEPLLPVPSAANQTNGLLIKEQSEQLRQEILKRASSLQQVLTGSMEALKSSSDLIVKRLLEQLNGRLEMARAKADKIINEPTTNELGLRALATINQGLGNLNNMVTNVVSRLDLSANGIQSSSSNSNISPMSAASVAQRIASSAPQLLDAAKIRANLQQLGSQVSATLAAASSLPVANHRPQQIATNGGANSNEPNKPLSSSPQQF